MICSLRSNRRASLFWTAILFLVLSTGLTEAQQFRALWVDAWGAGFKTSAEVSQLISDARAGNFNAVIVQVRRRGDAFYNNSPYEPKTADTTLSPANFDPLADLISKAHNTNNGPRIEVHAWVVTFNIWNNRDTPPSQPTHPYNLHPDWLTQDRNGVTWDGGNYAFDPGHPDVQKHTFNVAMDIINRYDIDGFNWDYIRYAGNIYGYNPTTVERFNRLSGHTGLAAATDPAWLQFRRNQVTALVRKVYLHAQAVKPRVKISADTITWAPGVTTDAAWTNSARAYIDVLQDWRSWMEEGIIDLNIPMTYFDQRGSYVSSWNNWNTFAKQHRFNRHVTIGPALYLNNASNSIAQIRQALSPVGPASSDGVAGYSYRVTGNDGVSRSNLFRALTQPSVYDNITPPVFAQRVEPPVMPWKTAPTAGHLKGFVYRGSSVMPIDGAAVTLTGPRNRTMTSDATGFYGAVDLAPGNYSITTTAPGLGTQTRPLSIVAGQVTTIDLVIPLTDTTPPGLSAITATNITDQGATIRWTTDEPADSAVDFGPTASYGTTTSNAAPVIEHSINLSGLSPDTLYHYRVHSSDQAHNQTTSGDLTFRTQPEGVVADIIIDNVNAAVTGSWSTGSNSPDKYQSDYRYKSPGSGAAYLEYRPNIPVAGQYQVYAWHPEGSNRPTDAPHLITHGTGTQTVLLDQTANGGRWNLLGTYTFNAGTSGHVRVTDAFTNALKVVIADAIKWVYVRPTVTGPTITQEPQDKAAVVGGSASLEVVASGTPPFAYQWRFDGLPISGATSRTFTRSPVGNDHAGLYSALVSNGGGSDLSRSAVLTVRPPVASMFDRISLLPNRSVELVLRGEPSFRYELQRSDDMGLWQPLLIFTNQTGVVEFVDPPATNSSPRFYRMEQLP